MIGWVADTWMIRKIGNFLVRKVPGNSVDFRYILTGNIPFLEQKYFFYHRCFEEFELEFPQMPPSFVYPSENPLK